MVQHHYGGKHGGFAEAPPAGVPFAKSCPFCAAPVTLWVCQIPGAGDKMAKANSGKIEKGSSGGTPGPKGT